MLDTDDNVKIGDFGLAQVVKAEAVGTQKPVTAWVSPNLRKPGTGYPQEPKLIREIFTVWARHFTIL